MSDNALAIFGAMAPCGNGKSWLASREGLCHMESVIAKYQKPGWKENFPVKHLFESGVYAREMFLPKGSILIGKIHKHGCINVVSKGSISVMTEEGERLITAPATFVSAPGTKRAGVAHEDTIWTTFHATDKTDPEEIESEITFITFDEYDEYAKLKLEILP